jgi:hypothetical protein
MTMSLLAMHVPPTLLLREPVIGGRWLPVTQGTEYPGLCGHAEAEAQEVCSVLSGG